MTHTRLKEKSILWESLSIYKQQWKLHHNGNHLVTIKQVSKTLSEILNHVWCFPLVWALYTASKCFFPESYKRDRVIKPKCLGSVMVFLVSIFLNYDFLLLKFKSTSWILKLFYKVLNFWLRITTLKLRRKRKKKSQIWWGNKEY